MTRTALSSCGENLRQKLRALWQRMTIAERQQFIESLGAEQIELLLADWPLWARQLPARAAEIAGLLRG